MSQTQPKTPGLPEPTQPEPTPTWMRDFLRVLGIVVFGALFFTALVWFASIGLMLNKTGSDTVAADATWAGICAGVLVFLFPFLFYERDRLDDGFRRDHLIPLVVLGVLCGAVIITLVMMTWPFFLGARAVPGTVAADLGGDPASVLLVLLFVIGGMAWCLSIVLTMVIGAFRTVMWMLLPYLGSVFVFTLAGVKVFENPPTPASTAVWAAVAVAGLAVLTGIGALRNVIDKPQRRMTEAERAEAHRRHMEQRRRRGLTNEGPLPGIDTPQPGPPRAQPPRPPYPPRRGRS